MEAVLIKLLIATGLLVMVLNMAQRLMPGIMNPILRIARRLLVAGARFLWEKRERQGAAQHEAPRFRYREDQ